MRNGLADILLRAQTLADVTDSDYWVYYDPQTKEYLNFSDSESEVLDDNGETMHLVLIDRVKPKHYLTISVYDSPVGGSLVGEFTLEKNKEDSQYLLVKLNRIHENKEGYYKVVFKNVTNIIGEFRTDRSGAESLLGFQEI